MQEAAKVQPWKSVWPASNNKEGEQTLDEDVKKEQGVRHYKLSASRSAEFGYEEEVKVEEPKPEKK